MATDSQNTTDITLGTMYSNDSWAKGSSSQAVRDTQFPQTANALPTPETLWGEYFDNVLRGNSDGYTESASANQMWMTTIDADGNAAAVSRTFSDNNPTVLGDVGWSKGGDPACPYTPSLTSPASGGGTGFDWTSMNQGVVLSQIPAASDGAWPALVGDAKMSPDVGSAMQGTNNAANSGGRTPVYELGHWNVPAWPSGE